MSNLSDLIGGTEDEAKELVKTSLLELIQGAKTEGEAVIKETGEKVEKWLELKLEGELDSDELEALLNTRKRVVLQFLNTQEISARARLERVSIGLIDLVLNKAMNAIV